MTYTMAIALQKAVYAALSADAALQTLVGTAIFDAPPVGAIPRFTSVWAPRRRRTGLIRASAARGMIS